ADAADDGVIAGGDLACLLKLADEVRLNDNEVAALAVGDAFVDYRRQSEHERHRVPGLAAERLGGCEQRRLKRAVAEYLDLCGNSGARERRGADGCNDRAAHGGYSCCRPNSLIVPSTSVTVWVMTCPSSAGVELSGSEPPLVIRSRYSGVATIVPISLLSRAMIGCGVPFGAQKPS